MKRLKLLSITLTMLMGLAFSIPALAGVRCHTNGFLPDGTYCCAYMDIDFNGEPNPENAECQEGVSFQTCQSLWRIGKGNGCDNVPASIMMEEPLGQEG